MKVFMAALTSVLALLVALAYVQSESREFVEKQRTGDAAEVQAWAKVAAVGFRLAGGLDVCGQDWDEGPARPWKYDPALHPYRWGDPLDGYREAQFFAGTAAVSCTADFDGVQGDTVGYEAWVVIRDHEGWPHSFWFEGFHRFESEEVGISSGHLLDVDVERWPWAVPQGR